jgi:tetratricopeptide (TPR) repeat protein
MLLEQTPKKFLESLKPEFMRSVIEGEIDIPSELGKTLSKDELGTLAYRADALFAQGKYDESSLIWMTLRTLDPKDPLYLVGLGRIYLAQRKMEDAIHCIDLALKIDQAHPVALFFRAEIDLMHGRSKEAFDALRECSANTDPHYKTIVAAAKRRLMFDRPGAAEAAPPAKRKPPSAPAKKAKKKK